MNKKLKRMVPAVLLILSLGLTACDQVREAKEVSKSTAKEEQVDAEYEESENVNTLIGSWEDEKEVITFNADGTYEAGYYWWSGTYSVDETKSIITLVEEDVVNSKIEYYYTIEGDKLILQDIDNGEIGNVRMELARAEEAYEYEESENETVNPIIGSWENKNDVVTFNDDGTFDAAFYWLGGSYILDESNSIIKLVADLSGKEEYYYTIEDDTLILQNILDNGEIGRRMEFTRVKEDKAFYPIIGSWENKNDVVTFNGDGTFDAAFYWLGGTYSVDESSYEITLVADLSGKEEYFFTIDGDTLTLYRLNDEGQTTGSGMSFTRVK